MNTQTALSPFTIEGLDHRHLVDFRRPEETVIIDRHKLSDTGGKVLTRIIAKVSFGLDGAVNDVRANVFGRLYISDSLGMIANLHKCPVDLTPEELDHVKQLVLCTKSTPSLLQ